MKYIFQILTLLFWLASVPVAYAQLTGSTNKKAQKAYNDANLAFQKRQYDEGISLLNKALEKDDKFADAHLSMGHFYMFLYPTGEKSDLIFKHWETYLQLSPNQRESPDVAYILASLYIEIGRYDRAIELLKLCLDHPKRNEAATLDLPNLLETATFARDAVKKPLQITIQPLPPTINRFPLQYFPTITADKQTLVYVARKGTRGEHDEDLYISTLKNNEWEAPVPIKNINTEENEGTASISGDGRTLVFSSCGAKDTKGGCDIYISYRIGNQWTKPINLEPVNTAYWDSQPSLSADGKTIYFSSNRKGSIGKHDIWVSTQNDKGEWQTPQNLGDGINTSEDELAPFIHANGQTLFFSSSGYAGMGKLDLYLSNNEQGKWQTPQNLGYPLNTSKDETSITITSDGKMAFFGREERTGRQSVRSLINWFEVPSDWNIPYKSNYLKGIVFDEETKKNIAATVELIDLTSGQKIYSVDSDPQTGEYLMVITEGKNYGLYVNKKGYLFKSLSFDYQKKLQGKQEAILMDIPLQKIKAGVKTTLNNLSFESGKYDLLPQSLVELNKIAVFMRENASVHIEIAGHTDDVGADAANLELSRKRAQSVVQWLKQKGIVITRLQAKGYGETQPLNSNINENERQLNRRIEFRIIK